MTQSFGPEARGGACSAQVILSDDADPLSLRHPAGHPGGHVAGGLHAFAPELKDGGILIIEQDLVRVDQVCRAARRCYSVPGTRLAEELGKRMVLNIVMVGFFGAVTGIFTQESLRKAVEDSVPPAFRELNQKAFDTGFKFGLKHLSEGALSSDQLEVLEEVRE